MNQRIVRRSIFALGLSLLLSAGVQAQAFRTYLSGSGNDGNPCTLAAPCRLLPAAIAAVIDGGEVWMLDSANYNQGPIYVDKSVTILAVPGALGSVVGSNSRATIVINTDGVKVALRNLILAPNAACLFCYISINGIELTAAASLTVDKCLIANFGAHGITVYANGASALVIDSVIRGNGGVGVSVAGGSSATVTRTTISGHYIGVSASGNVAGTNTADITDSTMEGNNYGVAAWGTTASAVVRVSVRDSLVVQNTVGLLARSDAGGLTTLSASNNVISNNSSGMQATSSGARVWASGNTVSNNVTGLINTSALFESAGDNAVRNNDTDTAGAVTAIPKL